MSCWLPASEARSLPCPYREASSSPANAGVGPPLANRSPRWISFPRRRPPPWHLSFGVKGLPAFTGALVTTPRVTLKGSLPDQIFCLPKPVLDLESAEFADVIRIYNLPLLAVRAITDGAGEEIQEFLAAIINRHQGVPLSLLIPALCAAPYRVRYCLHLWRRSLVAGRNLAQALDVILEFLARQSSSRSFS